MSWECAGANPGSREVPYAPEKGRCTGAPSPAACVADRKTEIPQEAASPRGGGRPDGPLRSLQPWGDPARALFPPRPCPRRHPVHLPCSLRPARSRGREPTRRAWGGRPRIDRRTDAAPEQADGQTEGGRRTSSPPGRPACQRPGTLGPRPPTGGSGAPAAHPAAEPRHARLGPPQPPKP